MRATATPFLHSTAGMVLTLASLARKEMKPSLKLITARMYAQAGLIAGLCSAGIVGFIVSGEKKQYAQTSLHIRQFDEALARDKAEQIKLGLLPAETAAPAMRGTERE